MSKITTEEIKNMAEEIKVHLLEWNLAQDVQIFYNGIRCVSEETEDGTFKWQEEPGLPQEYCDHVARDHILTMTYEGPLYEMLCTEDVYYRLDDYYKLGAAARKRVCGKYPKAVFLEKNDREHFYQIVENTEGGISAVREALEFLNPSDFDVYEEYLREKKQLEEELETAISEFMEIGYTREEAMAATGELQVWDDEEEMLWEQTGDLEGLLKEITHMAFDEFEAIFEKYHVWHQFGEGWNFTCFAEGKLPVYLEIEGEEE